MLRGFPGGLDSKEPTCDAGHIRDASSIPGSGRSPGEENSNPLQYSCLKNPIDKGAYSPWGHKRVRHDLATNQQQTPFKFSWNYMHHA